MFRKITYLVFAMIAAPTAFAQNPCGGSTAAQGYRSTSIENSFSSVLLAPFPQLVFGVGTDNATSVLPFPSGFQFSYYGSPRAAAWVNSNGWVSFSEPGTDTGDNVHIDDAAGPNDAVFVWHDDLILSNTLAFVLYEFDPTPNAELLKIEWFNVSNQLTPSIGKGAFTFQCILFASTHATKPNVVEFHYDRTTSPPQMDPCESDNPSTYATTATVGCEGPISGTGFPAGASDPTDRGAANATFPGSDLRFDFDTFNTTGGAAAVDIQVSAGFCHRDKNPDTQFINSPCTKFSCYDDDNSSKIMGVQVPLPWKFSMFGRATKSFNMNYNGFIALGEGASFANFSNTVLPDPGSPNLTISGFWDDLEGANGSEMQYRTIGAPGCRVFSVEWHGASDAAGAKGDCVPGNANMTISIRMFESGAGDFFYGDPLCPFNTIIPGHGDDRIEISYDSDAFINGNFSGTIGIENHNGSFGKEVLSGNQIPGPDPNARYVVKTCDIGTVRYYGDASTNVIGGCLPEFQTNGVAPVVGNTFGVRMVKSTPGYFTALLVDEDIAPSGQGIPCPCGGIPTEFGTFFVNIFSPTLSSYPAPNTTNGGLCEGSSQLDFVLPNNPNLIGSRIYAQWIALQIDGQGHILAELTEGAKIVIGS